MQYVCDSLKPDSNGIDYCVSWVESQSLLDSLAITVPQAGQIAAAICGLLILGWIFGEIGSFLKRNMR